ncbi:hypothetical protein SLUN_14995 [Streptomyces lunaelactis]|uniref:Gram-positive cocci surface proteins LPxTG domain-containing protein n=1 Tax=Streptomyces lunaelactis TaxID=1535768 RepID=A0A2R4T2E4_9ACTN|nr:hypothetical protein [Streptomyces lunaelactis]AVZ73291.1 hypothetical protein SLUN_14995 [Streptomyces lunaelactis]NUK89023.1 hypothetical protein [Streptomyces lunaelactis]
MSHRLSLRALALATVAAAAVIVPSAAAFADTTPPPSARPTEDPAPSKGSDTVTAPQDRGPSAAPRGGVAAGDKPAPVRGSAPRGGVSAGERPAGSETGSSTTALAGSATALALLAGAGTIVVRRRANR